MIDADLPEGLFSYAPASARKTQHGQNKKQPVRVGSAFACCCALPASPLLAMQLRILVPADAPAYRALRLRGLREHPLAFTSSFDEESLRPLADSKKRLSSEGTSRIYGGWDAEQLVGMIGLTQETRLKNRHKGTLVGLFVAPEFTGRGIGRALVEHLLHEARGAGLTSVVLTVTVGNERARALYAHCGFRSFGIEPDALRVGTDSYAKEYMVIQFSRAFTGAIA